MKSDWFRSRLLSYLRIGSGVTLISAAAAMAFVAINPSGPSSVGKSDVKSLTPDNHTVSPLLRLQSQETPANVQAGGAGPQYGLFTCQVGLSSIPGRQCYDPYQMRTAYQVDSLISAGYDGTGHTIVIIDAFQNPNLVAQVAHFNAFYGLPAINLTQIAPD